MELIKKNNPAIKHDIDVSIKSKEVNYELSLSEEAKDRINLKARRFLDAILLNSKKISNTISENVLKTDIWSNYDVLEDNIKDVIKESNEIFFRGIDIIRMIGEREYRKAVLPPIIRKDESVSEVMDDDILHFVFPELLPKRIKPNNNNYYAEYKRVSLYYERFFLDFFEELNEGKSEKFFYNEKVVIFFYHHFSSPHLVRDHDNFELKRVIDCIAYNCLPSDSAVYCAHYCDYVMDNTNFSEIFVLPEKKFDIFRAQLNRGRAPD